MRPNLYGIVLTSTAADDELTRSLSAGRGGWPSDGPRLLAEAVSITSMDEPRAVLTSSLTSLLGAISPKRDAVDNQRRGSKASLRT
jgi:hypothetical protein